MRRYRYRTPALTGPWRGSALEAANDAVRAKQAVVDIAATAGIRWTVPGRIEEMIEEDAPRQASA